MIWILLPFCLAAAFILSGLESALLTVSRVRARHAADEGDKLAARLAALLEKRNEVIHSVTVLNRAMGLGAFALVALALVHIIGPWGWAVALLAALPVFIVGLELVPKLLFRRYPFRLLRGFAPVLTFLHRASGPTLWLARFLTPKHNLAAKGNDNNGLASLAKTVAGLGVLPEASQKLLHGLADFHPLRARDVMTPLKQLTALPPDLPLTGAVTLSQQTQLPWRAVLAADGKLQGWLEMTSLPAKPQRDRLVRQFMRPLLQLKESDPALRCLQVLRKRAEPVAAVLDEKGEAIGVVTQKALVQALMAQQGKHAGKNGNGSGGR